MSTLTELILEVENTSTPPGRLSEIQLLLSARQARMLAELEKMIIMKSTKWLLLRKECTSDTQTDKQWTRTEMGTQEEILKSQVKQMDILIKAIRSRLRVLEMEASNVM